MMMARLAREPGNGEHVSSGSPLTTWGAEEEKRDRMQPLTRWGLRTWGAEEEEQPPLHVEPGALHATKGGPAREAPGGHAVGVEPGQPPDNPLDNV